MSVEGRHILVSIDPGIDRIAAAIWRYDQAGAAPLTVGDVARLGQYLQGTYCDHTKASDALGVRLAMIAEWGDRLHLGVELLDVPRVVPFDDILTVVIETPAYAGAYKGAHHTHAMAAGMAKLHMATGAIAAAVSSWTSRNRIIMQPASKIDREMKQIVGRGVMRAAKIDLPDNDDVRSAVYIGADWLANATASRR